MKFVVVLLAFPLGILACSSAKQDEGEDPSEDYWFPEGPKWTAEATRAFEERKRLIEDELKELKDHEWAGRYYYGDGLGTSVSLEVAPRSGVTFYGNSDTGPYDRNFGSVEEGRGGIKLTFEFDNDREGFQGIAGEYHVVRWGGRRYLVSQEKLVAFCNAINAGMEPRNKISGDFLLRGEEFKTNVEDWPELPEEVLPYLLREPIHAKIKEVETPKTDVGRRGFKYPHTKVILTAGTKEGVLLDMDFYVKEGESEGQRATVTTVRDHESEAEVLLIPSLHKVPEAGLRVSTYWR